MQHPTVLLSSEERGKRSQRFWKFGQSGWTEVDSEDSEPRGLAEGTNGTNEGNTRGRALEGRGAATGGFLILAFLELITG